MPSPIVEADNKNHVEEIPHKEFQNTIMKIINNKFKENMNTRLNEMQENQLKELSRQVNKFKDDMNRAGEMAQLLEVLA